MDRDLFMNTLVAMVESGKVEVPITINVGGTFLQGDMISQREFFEVTAAMITADDPAQQEKIRQLFEGIPNLIDGMIDRDVRERIDEGVDPDLVEEDTEEIREKMLESFVHLKNVRVLSGGTWVEFSGLFWRGPRAAVEGFWIGKTTEA